MRHTQRPTGNFMSMHGHHDLQRGQEDFQAPGSSSTPNCKEMACTSPCEREQNDFAGTDLERLMHDFERGLGVGHMNDSRRHVATAQFPVVVPVRVAISHVEAVSCGLDKLHVKSTFASPASQTPSRSHGVSQNYRGCMLKHPD